MNPYRHHLLYVTIVYFRNKKKTFPTFYHSEPPVILSGIKLSQTHIFWFIILFVLQNMFFIGEFYILHTVWVHVIILIGLNSLNAVSLCVTTQSSAMMNVHVTRGCGKSSIVMRRRARTPFTTTDDSRTSGSWMRGWWFWKLFFFSKMSHIVRG